MSPDSALIGQTARQVRFRTYYEGVVLAIHRQVREPCMHAMLCIRADARACSSGVHTHCCIAAC